MLRSDLHWLGRSGLQMLGAGRRSQTSVVSAPKPINLPSIRRENAGNDPFVSLVPSGSGVWGSKEALAAAVLAGAAIGECETAECLFHDGRFRR
jgi:hypothetical protein